MLAATSIIGAEQPGEFPKTGEKSARKNVLVVDDERLVRWSIAEMLNDRGIDVVEAGDARSAMQEFGNGEGIDLVLLDLRLPDSDDLRPLARLRQKAAQIPVILMTAFATREINEEATALGASVVTKPFDLDDLAAEVLRVLASRVY